MSTHALAWFDQKRYSRRTTWAARPDLANDGKAIGLRAAG
jgi:hypothetical protein